MNTEIVVYMGIWRSGVRWSSGGISAAEPYKGLVFQHFSGHEEGKLFIIESVEFHSTRLHIYIVSHPNWWSICSSARSVVLIQVSRWGTSHESRYLTREYRRSVYEYRNTLVRLYTCSTATSYRPFNDMTLCGSQANRAIVVSLLEMEHTGSIISPNQDKIIRLLPGRACRNTFCKRASGFIRLGTA